MALVFAVFLIAVLAVFARAEGRARRVKQLRACAARAASFYRAVLASGAEIIERLTARLAHDHRNHDSLRRLFTPADNGHADGLGRSAEP